ncbi:MAG TPA: Rieske 2Fe-2S domain-containing protein [Candidatus Dormibacteraeota bacterium]|nr:Rieske 2Fe-2S domain-containing protein [Candidatus Dormibacteraeota bacterium]
MPERPENRVDKIVSDLLRGRRLNLRAGDAEEKEAITAAARFAAARQGPQRMSPEFRRRLAKTLESAPQETWLTRRAALVAGFGVAAGALAGGLVGKSLVPAETSSVSGAPSSPVLPADGSWSDVGALADFTEGQGKLVKAGAVGAFVFRRGDAVTAVTSMCSHLPCELWWDHGSSLLECPCHPVSFNPDGKPSKPDYTLPALNEVKARVTTTGRVEVLGT